MSSSQEGIETKVNDNKLYWIRWVIDFSYYILVITLIMNIIFGKLQTFVFTF